MKRLRFVMLGGFLGAGKTTALARLARRYAQQGLKVGLVTNDQAANLVDTNSLASQGFAVEEVAGACFCCRFDDLVGRVGKLEGEARPDVVLAEPVGSCTDLVATVVQPMKDLYGDRFEVAPYAVLFKPSHGLKILRGEPAGGFSPKAAYIFHKQLEEADAIVVNRADELGPGQMAEVRALVEKAFPGTPVLAASALKGDGFDELAAFLERKGEYGRKILDIDYDTYAEGEAELGWLNSTHSVHARGEAFRLDDLLFGVVASLAQELASAGAEIAHLKAIGLADGAFGVANVVSSDSRPELSLRSGATVSGAEITVNARVAADPARLEALVRQVMRQACGESGADTEVISMQSFRPGRPTPTHRYAAARP